MKLANEIPIEIETQIKFSKKFRQQYRDLRYQASCKTNC